MGRSLARALHAAGGAAGGVRLVAVNSRRDQTAQECVRELDGVVAVGYNDMAAHVDVVLLAVGDAYIEQVAADKAWGAGVTLVHISGAQDLSSLRGAADRGARVGSFHVMVSVPAAAVDTVSDAPSRFSGAVVAIDGDDAVRADLARIAETLSLTPLYVPAAFRARWHAAATLVGNASAALAAHAEHMLRDLPGDVSIKRAALSGLLASVARNLSGLPADVAAERAVSGPVARADVATVERHLEALGARDLLAYRYSASLVLLALRDQLPPDAYATLAAMLSTPDL